MNDLQLFWFQASKLKDCPTRLLPGTCSISEMIVRLVLCCILVWHVEFQQSTANTSVVVGQRTGVQRKLVSGTKYITKTLFEQEKQELLVYNLYYIVLASCQIWQNRTTLNWKLPMLECFIMFSLHQELASDQDQGHEIKKAADS